MKYIDVRWLHSFAEEPVRLVSELDADGGELRKIEIFADGRVGYACESEEAGGTRLSEVPVPSLQEINALGELEGAEIEAVEFEKLWSAHVRNAL